MQQLVAFFVRNSHILTFIFLELIALFFYFNLNANPQKAAFMSSASGFVGGVFEFSSRLTRQWNLAVVNDSLARENARLKMQLPNAQYSLLTEKGTTRDSLYRQQYQYTAAAVVNNSINRANNYITINRGSNDNIRSNSGLLSAGGNYVIGVVRKVSGSYAVAMSILHKETRISAKIKRNNYFGVLVWDGDLSTHLNLEALPRHAPVTKGDTIITSGYSTIFPEGALVGTVDTVYMDENSNFNVARVRLFVNMSDLHYVYVVDDLMRDEREQLEKEVDRD